MTKISSLGLEQVDAQILKEKGLIRSALKPVKILGNGELDKKVDITATVFSKSAKQKIESRWNCYRTVIDKIKVYSPFPELRSRIIFTLSVLVVVRIGAHIPIPGVDG